jgi:hypothetical protein
MTQDEVIEMAREVGAGMLHGGEFALFGNEKLEAFAKLVAAKATASEREACAKLLESRKTGANELMDAVRDMEAKAIRARGEQT